MKPFTKFTSIISPKADYFLFFAIGSGAYFLSERENYRKEERLIPLATEYLKEIMK
jgi:hypothetical protein